MTNGTLTQEQIEQEFLQGLNRLANMNTVDESLDDYLRYLNGERKTGKDGKPIGPDNYVSTLESMISPIPNALRNAQPQAIQYEAEWHQGAFKADVEEAAKKYEDRVISEYAGFKNRLLDENNKGFKSELEKALEKVPDDKKELAREQETRRFEAKLYQAVGTAAADFVLKEDYKGNKELIDAANDLKELREASPDKRANIAATLTTQKHRLSSNFPNLVKDWNKEADGLEAMYARVIGKALVEQKDGNYTINQGLLKEAYGNVDSIKKMSAGARVNYMQSQAQNP